MNAAPSRVAITLATQRLMTASFEDYELAYPSEGLKGGLNCRSFFSTPRDLFSHVHASSVSPGGLPTPRCGCATGPAPPGPHSAPAPTGCLRQGGAARRTSRHVQPCRQ
jgi:hypothetical protein